MDCVLGTANLRQAYGTTSTKLMSSAEAQRLIEVAVELGILEIDTAPNYGEAESFLGESSLAPRLHVTTKMQFKSDLPLSKQIENSRRNLRVPSLHGLLIHDWHLLTLEESRQALEGLGEAKGSGHVRNIGVSVYEEWELLRILELGIPVDLVQVPVNVLDQRLLRASAISELRAVGTKLIGRSILLQGLLAAPDHFRCQSGELLHFHQQCAEAHLSGREVALGFVAQIPWLDYIVLAADTAEELRQLVSELHQERLQLEWHTFEIGNLAVLDPRRWQRESSP